MAVGRALDGFRIGEQHVHRHAAGQDHFGNDGLLRILAIEDQAELPPAGRGIEHRPLLWEHKLARNIGLRVREHVRHAALLGDAAFIDDGHAVADLVDDLHLVRDDNDRHAERLVDLAQQLQDRARRVGVERAGRLVAEQVPGLGRQRTGDCHALLLSAGQLRGEACGLVGKAHDLQQLLRALLCLRLRRAGNFKREADVAQDRPLLKQVEALEDHADLPAYL